MKLKNSVEAYKTLCEELQNKISHTDIIFIEKA
jgi:hypothetical protein